MAERQVAERGVLTAPTEIWGAAVRQAEVIRSLAAKDTVGLADADEAAAELRISRCQVYVLLRRWRAGEGVVSDLLPGRSSGGRSGEHTIADLAELFSVSRATVYRVLERHQTSVAPSASGGQ
jgi:putative transposase